MKIFVLLSLWLVACADSKPVQTKSTSVMASPLSGSCFEKYIDKLDQLLTSAEIISVYPTASSLATYEYSRVGPIEYHVCQYLWDSERTYMVKVGTKEVVVKRPNKIGIGLLSTYGEKIKDPLVYFKNAYRTPTAEDLAEVQKISKKKMDEQGLSASDQKIGTDLAGAFSDLVSFSAIDGVGDAAAWDHKDSALVILVGRTKFKVYVEVSADEQSNQRLAIQLAKIVLAKC